MSTEREQEIAARVEAIRLRCGWNFVEHAASDVSFLLDQLAETGAALASERTARQALEQERDQLNAIFEGRSAEAHSCPKCKTGRNSVAEGGNAYCFHCGSCGYLSCVDYDDTLKEKLVAAEAKLSQLQDQRADLLAALTQIDMLPSELAGDAWAIARGAMRKLEAALKESA